MSGLGQCSDTEGQDSLVLDEEGRIPLMPAQLAFSGASCPPVLGHMGYVQW